MPRYQIMHDRGLIEYADTPEEAVRLAAMRIYVRDRDAAAKTLQQHGVLDIVYHWAHTRITRED